MGSKSWSDVGRWAFAVAAATSGVTIASAALPPASLRLEALRTTASLRTLRRPEPPNLGEYVVDRAALLRLGKALFWDEQLGSDGQACASCHYHAGADARSKNQLNPGFRNETFPGGDSTFGNGPLAAPGAPAFAANHQLTPEDFPLHRLSNPDDRLSAVLSDTNDVVSSQGVFAASFAGVGAPGDLGSAAPAGVFAVGGARVRNVEPRNTPSTVNAVFNMRNFWDGRARSEFNGANPIGALDPGALVVNVSGAARLVPVSIADSSLASQAAGPPLSDLEMSFAGRRFPDLGRKMLAPGLGALAEQLVAPDDSVLGAYSNQRLGPGVRGTSLRYADLVRQAFAPEWWDGGDARVDLSGGAPAVVAGGGAGPDLFTAMEFNFPLFFALAIAEYERTLVSDDTPFDRFMQGDLGALGPREQAGLEVFIGQGRCVNCHGGPALTNAAVHPNPFRPQEIIERMPMGVPGPNPGGVIQVGDVAAYDDGFYNIGVRPTAEDLGIGAAIGPLGLPLSDVRRGQDCVRATVDALRAADPLLAQDAAVRQANAGCGVPRIPARPVEATLLLDAAASRLGNPADVVALLARATTLLAGEPIASNFVSAYADLSEARSRLAANPAVTPEIERMLAGAGLLLPDPVDPGSPLAPFGPPLQPGERVASRGAFKTPGLRNVALTAPYFHNGGQATLAQVVDFYNRGGDFSDGNVADLDADITRLQLFPQQKADLVAFLEALTDERVRFDRAPFDHPSLSLPNGGTEGVVGLLAGMAVLDDRVDLPAVGASGAPVPLGTAGTAFANFPDALWKPEPPPASPEPPEPPPPVQESPGPGAPASPPAPPGAAPAAPDAAPVAPAGSAGGAAAGGCSTAPGAGLSSLLLAASALLFRPRRTPSPKRGTNAMRNVVVALLSVTAAPALAAPTRAPIIGEIQRITVDDPADHWSGGTLVVGGQVVILPRNLLIDLPANRVTLRQLVVEAPPACAALGETGLARGDACNARGVGGIAALSANRTNAGNVIAGDVLISKGIDAVTGEVTYVDHDGGWFRLNGLPGDATTGVMVRLNDPDGRHTVQQGPGCAGGPNCSPDPRFTLDPDNYTNVFSTGYPLCIPSTVPRTFPDVLGLGVTTAQASPDGTGDALCPETNRPPIGVPVSDSRRFAPIQVGDGLTAEGNFERVGGVEFLSAHTTMISRALTTRATPDQPDYLFLDEVGIDTAGFQNQRARSLIIGHATRAPTDVLIWSIHYDPRNVPHEFPLASTLGCDGAAGVGTCTSQGLIGAGANIFKIVHDVDFVVGVTPGHSPCAHLRADFRFLSTNVCPSAGAAGTSSLAEEFAVLSPTPREIQARTGHRLANPSLVTVDVNGNPATNGQYLFPFGANLGGIGFPEFNEINLDFLNAPYSFGGLPWALDRRLSPGGCADADGDGDPDCEPTPQPLDPFPYEGIDPRFQASVPFIAYGDTTYTASLLTHAYDRILSYVDPGKERFDGDATVLAWPPADPPFRAILPTPGPVVVNHPPTALPDVAATLVGTPITIAVLANDSDVDGDPLGVSGVQQAQSGIVTSSGGSVTYTPDAGFAGEDVFGYAVLDGQGGTATASVRVTVSHPVSAPAPSKPPSAPPAPSPAPSSSPSPSPAAPPVAAAPATPGASSAPAAGGCASAGPGATLWMLLAPGLLALRRRRSR